MFFIIVFLIISALLIVYVYRTIPFLKTFTYCMLSIMFILVLMLSIFIPSNAFYEPIQESVVELSPLSGKNFYSNVDIYLYKNNSNEYFYSFKKMDRCLNFNESIYQKDNDLIIRLSKLDYNSRIKREKETGMIVKVIEEDTNKATLEIYVEKGKPNFFTFAINCYRYTYIFRLSRNSVISEI